MTEARPVIELVLCGRRGLWSVLLRWTGSGGYVVSDDHRTKREARRALGALHRSLWGRIDLRVLRHVLSLMAQGEHG